MFLQDSHFWGTFKKSRLFSLLEQKGGRKIILLCPTCDSKFVRSSPLTPPAGGGLHRLHAHSEGTWPGEGDQEEGGALSPAVPGRGTWHCTLCHCTVTLEPPPTPQQGPYEHWRGRLDDLNERLFFYSRVITFVKTPTEYLESDRPLNPLVFFLGFVFNSFVFFHGFPDGQNWHRQIRWFSFFLPRHCDCISEKLHPIPYLCNTTPSQLPRGGAVRRQRTRQ